MTPHLEAMDAFFAARVVGYDDHMIQNVEGCREGYAHMAELIPAHSQDLLDLGCGTGLELDAIFKRFPHLAVTGIDLTPAMLKCLSQKHPSKRLHLICGDYFATELGSHCFDCAVSFETLHHFSPEKKLGLYQKIYRALQDDGQYIECDYMVQTEAEEAFYFAEAARLRYLQGIPDDAFVHYDTPCTVEHQIDLLKKAGFRSVKKHFQKGNTVLLVAQK